MATFMKALPEAVNLIDASGDLRRAGALDLDAVPVVESETEWTAQTTTVFFRVCGRRLYRKDVSRQFIGGYSIRYAPIGSRIALEWLALGAPVRMGHGGR